ncbi:MAG: twin-arginine translocase subunit TatC [Alphaproteobacteria bacterium]|nr:twin-arginine translocase subunit TatC [Alphaproteobacteria bacterium]
MTLPPSADPSDEPADPSAQPLLAHLVELRQRLIYCLLAILAGFVIAYVFAPEIYAFLARPLADASEGAPHRFIYTNLTEAFVSYIRLALWAGCFVAFPLIAAQVWMFIAPGLYKSERKVFLPFFIATPVLFLIGAALAYYVVMPMAWRFFLSFESVGGLGALPIQLEARVAEYLSLSMTLIFAFGLAFELPLALILLARAGVLSAAALSSFRRYAIVIIFATAAVLTPPDLISMICLALPVVLLYEVSIFGAKWVERTRK